MATYRVRETNGRFYPERGFLWFFWSGFSEPVLDGLLAGPDLSFSTLEEAWGWIRERDRARTATTKYHYEWDW